VRGTGELVNVCFIGTGLDNIVGQSNYTNKTILVVRQAGPAWIITPPSGSLPITLIGLY